jgi:Leucine-rich repeat (LRR) protein
MSALMTGFLEVMSECPKPELVNPCMNDTIFCEGTEINLKHMLNLLFQTLDSGKKHFKKFDLYNTSITELEKNTFYDIVFDEIDIRGAYKLKFIHTEAFSQINLVTKILVLYDNPIENQPPNYDFFNVCSKIKSLETLKVGFSQIEEIPSFVFRPINGFQTKLKTVEMCGQKLKKINDNAFYDLDNISFIDFSLNSIINIPLNAFHFRKESKEIILIALDINQFNGSKIETSALSNINRPVRLDFFCGNVDCQTTYLDEKIFAKFLDVNPLNKIQPYFGIYLYSDKYLIIDCNDCRPFWIRENLK